MGNFPQDLHELLPALGCINVIRQWAGTRDFYPDGTLIMGSTEGNGGLSAISGQGGFAWILCPAISEASVLLLTGKDLGIDLEVYSPIRFLTGVEGCQQLPYDD